jgi:drug/metabolite transporter (DMT)-like permease
MDWVIYALISTVAMAAADFCMKLAAGKVSNSLGLWLYGCSTFTIGLGWVLWQRLQGIPQHAQVHGVLSALGVGFSFCVVVVAFYVTFAKGAPISVVTPVIRLGGLLVASAAGIVLLREPITLRYVIGMLLSCVGVYLIITR